MNTELILSIVLTCSTVVYTVVTIFQVFESRKVRFQKETPNIVPYFKMAETSLKMNLCIENFGEGVAKDVKVEFIKDFPRFKRTDLMLSKIGVSENGMNYFPPKYRLSYGIGSMSDIYKEFADEKIVIKITYKSLNNSKFSNIYELPFYQISGQGHSTPPETYLGQISYYLERINNQLKSLTNKLHE